jgi:hypothetical protein
MKCCVFVEPSPRPIVLASGLWLLIPEFAQ